jgi:hypothetical protein
MKRRIDLVKMKMGAHLDWPVSCISDGQANSFSSGVKLDLASLGDDFARDHELVFDDS